MASGISTKFFLENPNEICKRINSLLQEERAGNYSNVINRQSLQYLIKCSNISHICETTLEKLKNVCLMRLWKHSLVIGDFYTQKMFKLNEKYEVDRELLECDYIRHSHAETSTINIPCSQIQNNIPVEDFIISLLNSNPHLKFELIKKVILSDMQMVMAKS